MTSALIVMPTLIVNRAIFCSGVITRYQVGPGPEREVDTAPRREALGGRGVIGPHVDDLPKVRGLAGTSRAVASAKPSADPSKASSRFSSPHAGPRAVLMTNFLASSSTPESCARGRAIAR